MLVAASMLFRKALHPVDLRNHVNWWDWTPGVDFAASSRRPSLAGVFARRTGGAGVDLREDAETYAQVGGEGAAHRG